MHFGASHSALGLGNSTEKIISVTPRNRISDSRSQFGGKGAGGGTARTNQIQNGNPSQLSTTSKQMFKEFE